jgi:putative ATPase
MRPAHGRWHSRAALTLAEEVWRAARRTDSIRPNCGKSWRRAPIYDKSQDGHYNLISALRIGARL